jgi:hypothetical protein
VDALHSTGSALTLELARQFLALLATQRETANLSTELIAFGQHSEWLVGLPRYLEIEIWRQTGTGDYVPFAETDNLTDFNGYASYARRWSGNSINLQEWQTIKMMDSSTTLAWLKRICSIS